MTASPNPFIPTGTNAAEITVEAAPGQTGLKLFFGTYYWRNSSGSYHLPLTEDQYARCLYCLLGRH